MLIIALAPRASAEQVHELHGLRTGRSLIVVLALAPRTFVLNVYKSFTNSHDQRSRSDVWQESGP
eukprot:4297434-Pyramimonas_sp.AAC.1